MKSKNVLSSITTLMLLLFICFNSKAQNVSKSKVSPAVTTVEMIQFHSEHRCKTCNKIEELTRETLKGYSNIPFSLVNVDEKKNEKKAEQFEATGTALFLYNSNTGKKKDLTDLAFLNATNKDKFITSLKKEIDAFLK